MGKKKNSRTDLKQDDMPDFSNGMTVVGQQEGEAVFAFRPAREQEIIAVVNSAKSHADELEAETGLKPEDFA